MIPSGSLPRFVAQTLWEGFLQAKWAGEILTNKLWKQNRRVHPEGIVNKDLGYVSQIFLPKRMANDTVPCGFVYVIVLQV